MTHVYGHRRLILHAGNTLSDRARNRLSTTGKLQAVWLVEEQLWTLPVTGSLTDAAAAKDRLQALVEQAANIHHEP